MDKKPALKTEAEWQQALTPEQFAICIKKGTERPFSGQYNDCKEQGIYCCICCSNPLFDSQHKYDSGSGWPSYYRPIAEEAVKTASDISLGTPRTEVLCRVCNAHLGHVFPDGPQPTGLRYCINSVALNLKKRAE